MSITVQELIAEQGWKPGKGMSAFDDASNYMGEDYSDCVVGPSQTRDSGSLEQDADAIAFLYRDEVYDPGTHDRGVSEVIVAKQPLASVATSHDCAVPVVAPRMLASAGVAHRFVPSMTPVMPSLDPLQV